MVQGRIRAQQAPGGEGLRILAALLLSSSSLAVEADAVRKAIGELSDPAFDRREAASERLVEWGCEDPDAVLPVLATSCSDGDAERRERIATVQHRIRWESRRRSALLLSGHPVWKESVNALFDRPSRKTLDRLWTSKSAGPAETSRVLAGFLDHPSPELRGAVCTAFIRAKYRASVRLLVPVLGDEDPKVRVLASDALERLGNRDLEPELIQILGHPEHEARALAVHVLASLHCRGSAAAVHALLQDKEELVRQKAFECLAKMRDPASLPILLQALKDPEPRMRSFACMALSGFGSRSALPSLAALLEDPVPAVRVNAAAAIGGLTQQDWSEDPDILNTARAWWAAHKDDPELNPPK